MRDFQVQAQYSFYTSVDPAAKYAALLFYEQAVTALECKFTLDLPDIRFDLDSSQFFVVAAVTRNLLLAPPPKQKKEASRAGREREREREGGGQGDSQQWPLLSTSQRPCCRCTSAS